MAIPSNPILFPLMDLSHRDWQVIKGGGQWALGKGFDGWAPFGLGLVSPQVLRDPRALRISTAVNGEVVQESSTNDLIFSVAKIISFLSTGTTLLPGDVIYTGTPEGVQLGSSNPKWLVNGDVVEVMVDLDVRTANT
ncbi:uncharacterized protein PAC_04995 [Phialocephala subalpina]|uniref:Fumarylacetoacetase-like C-terminal domain-containing protein n=1 Tax=Phialocephala subalpina TaxID=576137 RepID=A0A1L7WQR3_9HELO|nr:uncharacterized protein PAC_04995 [Phialocephala subalpina]